MLLLNGEEYKVQKENYVQARVEHITCHESYAAFRTKSGVFMYGNIYCGKKHCDSIYSYGERMHMESVNLRERRHQIN